MAKMERPVEVPAGNWIAFPAEAEGSLVVRNRRHHVSLKMEDPRLNVVLLKLTAYSLKIPGFCGLIPGMLDEGLPGTIDGEIGWS